MEKFYDIENCVFVRKQQTLTETTELQLGCRYLQMVLLNTETHRAKN